MISHDYQCNIYLIRQMFIIISNMSRSEVKASLTYRFCDVFPNETLIVSKQVFSLQDLHFPCFIICILINAKCF